MPLKLPHLEIRAWSKDWFGFVDDMDSASWNKCACFNLWLLL